MIKANNLTMIYGGDFKSVDNLTFNVKKGEILGFVGPNGAGKTTVIKMLTGILKPVEGNVIINGFDMNDKPLEAKQSLAYVSSICK